MVAAQKPVRWEPLAIYMEILFLFQMHFTERVKLADNVHFSPMENGNAH